MMTSLTPKQIEIIQKTWAIPSQNAIESGEDILIAYFSKYPKNQDKFNSFKNTPVLMLKVCVYKAITISKNKKTFPPVAHSLNSIPFAALSKCTRPRTCVSLKMWFFILCYICAWGVFPHELINFIPDLWPECLCMNSHNFTSVWKCCVCFSSEIVFMLFSEPCFWFPLIKISNFLIFFFFFKQQGTPGFRTHAGRIMTVFDEAITSLSKENYVEEVERIWSKIGESHKRRKISRQSFEVSVAHSIFNSKIRFSLNYVNFYLVASIRNFVLYSLIPWWWRVN